MSNLTTNNSIDNYIYSKQLFKKTLYSTFSTFEKGGAKYGGEYVDEGVRKVEMNMAANMEENMAANMEENMEMNMAANMEMNMAANMEEKLFEN
jgi:hypothetical protein